MSTRDADGILELWGIQREIPLGWCQQGLPLIRLHGQGSKAEDCNAMRLCLLFNRLQSLEMKMIIDCR
jgi:hypothetical protein